MITADHLAEAKAYVDELTNGADYIPATCEWMEHVTGQLPDVDGYVLWGWLLDTATNQKGFEGSVIGAVVVLYAKLIAEREATT